MKPYREKLKDPRWQKRRLEVLSRDEFSCQICGDTSNTLHVHHRFYKEGAEPWDYGLDALVTLCESCHECESTEMPRASRILLDRLKSAGISSSDMLGICNALDGLFGVRLWSDVDWSVVSWAICRLANDSDWLHQLREEYFAELAQRRLSHAGSEQTDP